MGRTDNGTVETLSTSGSLWSGYHAQDIRTMFFELLLSAKTSIRISAFSMGKKNPDTEEFFQIIEDKLLGHKKITMIVNDDENIHDYSRKRLRTLQKRFPESDDPLVGSLHVRYFDPFRKGKKRMILHSKVAVVDRKYALIGSANISRNALLHNYEIMLKIKGKSVSRIDDMLIELSYAIKNGDSY